MKPIHAVLFDLDGTLLDTAPDLVKALNRLRLEHGLTDIPLSTFKSIVSLGSKAMIKFALGIQENHVHFESLRQKFLSLYEYHIADSTQFYPNIDKVLM